MRSLSPAISTRSCARWTRQASSSSPPRPNFRWDLYEHVVKETTTQTGTIFFKKQGTDDRDGREDRVAFKVKIHRVSQRGPSPLRSRHRSPDHRRHKNKAQLESFLTLGFGGSGKDLAKAWTISDLGDEVIDGVKTAKLDLVPKDPAVRKNCTHMTIWVDPVRGISAETKPLHAFG